MCIEKPMHMIATTYPAFLHSIADALQLDVVFIVMRIPDEVHVHSPSPRNYNDILVPCCSYVDEPLLGLVPASAVVNVKSCRHDLILLLGFVRL